MRILYIEPFNGGSHAAFGASLTEQVSADWTELTLPGRHWKWRMRGAAAYFAVEHRDTLEAEYNLILASSFTPMAELVGMIPTLARTPKVLYFHENQLAYPANPASTASRSAVSRNAGGGDGTGASAQGRDLHFGFTQLNAGLAADELWFNSQYNRDSFFSEADKLLARMPDFVPSGWVHRLRARSRVFALPLEFPATPLSRAETLDRNQRRALGPILLWNHRWEHDKDPEAFFAALEELVARRTPFRLIVCGQSFRTAPPIFAMARDTFSEQIQHWGFAASRVDYWDLLRRADIAVSTARHEFFGIAMLEAAHAGAIPLVPDRLAYPELFPPEFRYDDDLVERLDALCRAWSEGRTTSRARCTELASPFSSQRVIPTYTEAFERLARDP